MKHLVGIAVVGLVATMMSGCAVVAVADAAVSVAATAVKTGAKVVGAAVDAVLPDSSDKDKKK
jgi:hypothetical protein